MLSRLILMNCFWTTKFSYYILSFIKPIVFNDEKVVKSNDLIGLRGLRLRATFDIDQNRVEVFKRGGLYLFFLNWLVFLTLALALLRKLGKEELAAL